MMSKDLNLLWRAPLLVEGSLGSIKHGASLYAEEGPSCDCPAWWLATEDFLQGLCVSVCPERRAQGCS